MYTTSLDSLFVCLFAVFLFVCLRRHILYILIHIVNAHGCLPGSLFPRLTVSYPCLCPRLLQVLIQEMGVEVDMTFLIALTRLIEDLPNTSTEVHMYLPSSSHCSVASSTYISSSLVPRLPSFFGCQRSWEAWGEATSPVVAIAL